MFTTEIALASGSKRGISAPFAAIGYLLSLLMHRVEGGCYTINVTAVTQSRGGRLHSTVTADGVEGNSSSFGEG
jgi:hypothetical protein